MKKPIIILLSLTLILLLFGCFEVNDELRFKTAISNNNPTHCENIEDINMKEQCKIQVNENIVAEQEANNPLNNLISDNLAEFKANFDSMTDLQKEEYWKTVKDQYVKWTFYADNIDKDFFGNLTVLGYVTKPGNYDVVKDISVKFKDDQKEKLLTYNEGDLMTIIAQLDSYGSIVNSDQITLKNAMITETESPTYADEGKYSQDCQIIKELCETGQDCLAYTTAYSEGLCK